MVNTCHIIIVVIIILIIITIRDNNNNKLTEKNVLKITRIFI